MRIGIPRQQHDTGLPGGQPDGLRTASLGELPAA
jgi:hypothetical protein